MTFKYWFNEIADMPMKDKNGNWYDAETGFYFNYEKVERVKKQKSETEVRYGALKADALLKTVERLVERQRYSIRKYIGKVDVSAAEAVVDMFEALVKPTKAQLYEVIDANVKASRVLNQLTNQGRI